MKNLNMQLDHDTGFIALVAMRYGIGRMSYAPSLIVNWLKRYWDTFNNNTKAILYRDLTEEIERANRYLKDNKDDLDYLGHTSDRQTWESFNSWMREKLNMIGEN